MSPRGWDTGISSLEPLRRRLHNDFVQTDPEDRERCGEWIAPATRAEVQGLIAIAEAAHAVARERSGHELGGEHPLYVKLCALDEALSVFYPEKCPCGRREKCGPMCGWPNGWKW